MRYVVETGNVNSGGDTNLAQTVFHLGEGDLAPDDVIAAQLVAFMQYCSCGGESYVAGIYKGGDAPGPTLPLIFPTVQYGLLEAADPGLLPMDGWGYAFGVGDLAPLGAGMVLSKRTGTAGRTGRGRLTSPWLRTGAVTPEGQAALTNTQFMIDGYFCYIKGDHSVVTTAISVDLEPYIYPAMALILNVTSTSRLGRLRSRTQ